MLKDQIDLLCVFNEYDVKYVVIGGHAVGFHAEPRGTKDLDVLIEASAENAKKVHRALVAFGAPMEGLRSEDFHNDPDGILQIGVPPSRVDVLQSIVGVSFDEVWRDHLDRPVTPQVYAHVISREHLIANKLAAGRAIDLADAEKLRDAAAAEQS